MLLISYVESTLNNDAMFVNLNQIKPELIQTLFATPLILTEIRNCGGEIFIF